MPRYFFLSLLITVFYASINAHPWKPAHYVIVDTDGGIDDMRAITLLLASHDVRLLAVTVSPGALPASTAYIKVKSLLNTYHHEGLPVGINRSCSFVSPSFTFAAETRWGTEESVNPESAPGHLELIAQILAAEKTRFSFISLGGLSTAREALGSVTGFSTQVKDFIWSADGAGDKKGFNYNIDKKAAEALLKQEVPVKIVRAYTQENFYDRRLTDVLGTISNPYASMIVSHLSKGELAGHGFAFYATDEMVPLFLHYPELFLVKTAYSVSDCSPADPDSLQLAYVRIIKGETVAENQVMKKMPEDPGFYFDDVAPYVSKIIKKHGHDEWSAGVLANEMHRHLGVYATIGVKMGIRAREYFCTGVDEFRAVSFAGSQQPLSCMNDGVLVSTGATPGHGLLTVIESDKPLPSAEFTYLNRKIRVTLKPEIAELISSELKQLNFVYGLDSNIYWELVRKKAIDYWLSFDRHEIFTIEEL